MLKHESNGVPIRSLLESQRPVQTRYGHSSWTSSTSTNGSRAYQIATASMARTASSVACGIVLASPSCPKCTDDVGKNCPLSWAKERLVSIDPTGRSLSYDMVGNNIGYISYLATFKVVPNDQEGEGEGGCTIEWSFTVNPVEGWALEDLVRVVYEDGLQGMAKKMEDSFGN